MNPVRILLCALLILLQPAVASAAPADDLLAPEQAFALDVSAESGHLIATWRIAPGYYMYRDKYTIEAAGSAVQLGKPVIPRGTRQRDALLGEGETLVGVVRIEIPFRRVDRAARKVTLTVRGQGCNKPVGICYPPQTHTVTLTLAPPPAASPPTATTARSAQSALVVTMALAMFGLFGRQMPGTAQN